MKFQENIGVPSEKEQMEATLRQLEQKGPGSVGPVLADKIRKLSGLGQEGRSQKKETAAADTTTNAVPVNTSDKPAPKPRRQFTTFLERSLPPGDRD